ncbi:MAG: hypothetical protein WDN72_10235 [Alphaproteobacteria bacterium]
MKFVIALLVAFMVFCSYLLVDQYLVEKKRRESLKAAHRAGRIHPRARRTRSRCSRSNPSPRRRAR